MTATPICDFVREYAESRRLRLHMPGHKGIGSFGEALDITEIDGADVLYHARGIIKESENIAASLFDTASTLYSAEGSSLAIRAMLYLTLLWGRRSGNARPLIFAGRNAHKTFMTAAALLDIDVTWLYPDDSSNMISCKIAPESLERALKTAERLPTAVYITSPDYLGNVSDIAVLSAVCRRYGVLLLVDNAHGAYLKFLPEDRHPISLGADMCCDSAHKTLPVLTGGAYLHISRSAPAMFVKSAETAMSMFASTSPSYLILQSLDAANRYITDGYRQRLSGFTMDANSLKLQLTDLGFTLSGDEPLKLTLSPKSYGYAGDELSSLLYENGIVVEFADPDYVVMMLSPELGKISLERLWRALSSIPKRTPIISPSPAVRCGTRIMSIRDALTRPSVELPIDECLGRVLAVANVSCPPAIPILVSGELIDEHAVAAFRYYGVDRVRVLE